MSIIGIAAIDLDNGIGKNNEMLFHIKEDLNFFKQTTLNKIVVMGRKTFESIGKPLPNRINVVLSSNSDFNDCINLHSFEELLNYIQNQTTDVFIIGGASLYEQMLPYYDKIFLTKVYAKKEADTFFPIFDTNILKLINKSDIVVTENYYIQFLIYEKIV